VCVCVRARACVALFQTVVQSCADANPCFNGGTCVTTLGSTVFDDVTGMASTRDRVWCSCRMGYTGDQCQDGKVIAFAYCADMIQVFGSSCMVFLPGHILRTSDSRAIPLHIASGKGRFQFQFNFILLINGRLFYVNIRILLEKR
jgi:hypothetical protein